MELPFDGAISAFYSDDAPAEVRDAIKKADKDDILLDSYPHRSRLESDVYESEMEKLQIEMVKLQAWSQQTGMRMVAVFEGRDAAGKGGTIGRVRVNLNPRCRACGGPAQTHRKGAEPVVFPALYQAFARRR